jgi:hypothetical protein
VERAPIRVRCGRAGAETLRQLVDDIAEDRDALPTIVEQLGETGHEVKSEVLTGSVHLSAPLIYGLRHDTACPSRDSSSVSFMNAAGCGMGQLAG